MIVIDPENIFYRVVEQSQSLARIRVSRPLKYSAYVIAMNLRRMVLNM